MKRKTKIREIYCPYCDVQLQYQGAHRIQLGRYGWFVEHWDQLVPVRSMYSSMSARAAARSKCFALNEVTR